MSEPTSKIKKALSAASSSVATAVETIIDESVELNPETCEPPLSNRIKVIGAGAGAGMYVGHKIARKTREIVQAAPRVGPVVYTAIDATASAVGALKGMSIANDAIQSKVDTCILDAKQKAKERFEATGVRQIAHMHTKLPTVNKAIAEIESLTFSSDIEKEEYIKLFAEYKELICRGYGIPLDSPRANVTTIPARDIFISSKNSSRESASSVPPVPAASSTYSSPARDIMRNISTGHIPAASSSVSSLANSQAASAFLSGTNIGLTNPSARTDAYNPAVRESLASASSGQSAINADLQKRMNALIPATAVAPAPVVAAPPAPPAINYAQLNESILRAAFGWGSGGGGFKISFGF